MKSNSYKNAFWFKPLIFKVLSNCADLEHNCKLYRKGTRIGKPKYTKFLSMQSCLKLEKLKKPILWTFNIKVKCQQWYSAIYPLPVINDYSLLIHHYINVYNTSRPKQKHFFLMKVNTHWKWRG